MNAWEMVSMALISLRTNKLRSFLTMLGILIGVASIIAIVAIGNGGKAAVLGAIASGSAQNTIQIVPRELVAPGLPQPGQVLAIDESDLAIAASFSGVQQVNYTLYGTAVVGSGNRSDNASIEAGPANLNELTRLQITRGHMFSQADVIGHRDVAVLSQSLANKLFGSGNPIGGLVTVSGVPLQVIGVAVSQQASLFSLFMGSDALYMPATTCQDLFPNWSISEMDVQAAPGTNLQNLAQRIVTALNIHAGDATAFADSSGLASSVGALLSKVTTILTLVIGAIAGIALLVGGVGVMNIMLVSVTERTQEIGIRISLGATRTAILFQFLVESATITAIGGLAGVVIGSLIGLGIRMATGIPASVPWPIAVLSFLFSAVIGVVCGLYPANKAARLNPIEALRYE
ncbi:hypothetical protein SD51_00860 [Alicyclobacillus tengchongensis]|nr:hypothetical protein SD51_00860 [Alicyclobacillus tengchongensis]